MSLVLRLARLPVVTGRHETFFQHSCLGNALKRHYVTSSDPQPRATLSSCPPESTTSDVTKKKEPPGQVQPEPKQTDSSDSKTSKLLSKKPLTGTLVKLQKASVAFKDETMQKAAVKAKTSSQQVRKNVSSYVFFRFFDHVKNYDKVLEKNFPSAMKVYRVFFDGVKEFFADMKRYLKIARIVNASSKGLRSLNRQELEVYMQMPRDMLKVAPALILSALPMVGYAIFPLVFMYPRNFLTSHFWTPQQRIQFDEYYFGERLTYNRSVFRCLQSKLKDTKEHPKHGEFAKLLGQLGSGTHPSVEQILDIKDIFADEPLCLVSLPGKHIKLLNKMHGMRVGLFKRHRLYELAFVVHYMDLAIRREGGVHNLPVESLRNACYIRGLNPVNLTNEEMISWLRDWIKVSIQIQAEHITLFLHLPLFLGYNHPNNWKLRYGNKKNQTK